jgi:hypothetical protein
VIVSQLAVRVIESIVAIIQGLKIVKK